MPADKIVLQAQIIESALAAQIENLRGIKSRITQILDMKSPLGEYERDRLQSLINLATGIEAYIDRPQPRVNRKRKVCDDQSETSND